MLWGSACAERADKPIRVESSIAKHTDKGFFVSGDPSSNLNFLGAW